MTVRVPVKPELLRWALKRADMAEEDCPKRFPLARWLNREREPTLKQLEDFAQSTHTPFGYLLLEKPPDEQLPITDFRTIRGTRRRGRISVNLRDTIDLCQMRQDWYRENQIHWDVPPIDFVRSASLDDDPTLVAAQMRSLMTWTSDARNATRDAEGARKALRDRMERLGILVMTSSVVGPGTNRPLKVEEFRGLALADDYAPLVFVNAADAETAKCFTLMHEFAHILLGSSGISDTATDSEDHEERWCNAVAAEALVPMREFAPRASRLSGVQSSRTVWLKLAQEHRVSVQVILNRLKDAEILSWSEYRQAWERETARYAEPTKPPSGGGNSSITKLSQLGRPFAEEVIVSVLEGRTTYREGFELLAVRSTSAFNGIASRLGILSAASSDIDGADQNVADQL